MGDAGEFPKISANLFMQRRVLPVYFALLLGAAAVGTIVARSPAVLAVLAAAVFGYFVHRYFVGSLVDEVRDGGSFLLVRKGDLEQRIELRDIVNVSFQSFVNPPRVSLLLRTAGPLGKEVVFSPKLGFRINVFANAPLVDELIARIDAARTAGRNDDVEHRSSTRA